VSDPAGPQAPATGKPTAAELTRANPMIGSGARWFWWIAGLSLVNVVMYQTESKTSFVVGLGMTLLSDVIFRGNQLVGFLIDAIVIGFFVLIGWQASRGKLAAFYIGLAVYVLDALIYVRAQDWMPVAFHGLAIYFIVKGAMSLRAALQKAG
jgi:hypothetical protein